ncbi:MarR family winged helix-turn-helix transcriptional regulator [Cyclobacterium amurskyense]|jgi:DNA-binding MarR family transcriptional regulator|uniref:HTH-type transcriptional regulator SarZ n=1 Tax=Cyclobacterium amurskyense TaxID=320787 RepID=A0A0H4P8Y7_9BACT|nr:MarR family transcriptional regulator [Cyclobacterium amurskyense]AKP50604.1 Transcriptional regulator, MarR family [Cyclobacterium amurskyense]|tara:strand:+ start:31811 stop:32275 length:465 start_codon:yes stop_codon:yes gene_type:complete
MDASQLELKNQICFPFYSVSRLITKAYKPFLSQLGLTYPQYLVLMVLWEADGISVNQIKEKLLLDNNTLSPLLKRIEAMGLIKRLRSTTDERSVIVSLTEKGEKLKVQALPIPGKMLESLSTEGIEIDEIAGLRKMLNTWMKILSKNNNQNENK